MDNYPPFVRAYPPDTAPEGPALYLPFRGDEAVLDEAGESNGPLLTPLRTIARDTGWSGDGIFLGTLYGVPTFTYRIPSDAPLPPGHRAVGLRAAYGQVEDVVFSVLGYASQILHWTEEHLYCAHCGNVLATVTEQRGERSWGKTCTVCDRATYPPAIPAVLLLIHDGGNRTLMVTKPGWGKRFSIVAGFVEPGESLEECCQREAKEEVGVDITDITYFGSQAWPFPHQVMIGFTARYVSGDIVLDTTELADARWFTHDAMPDLPPALSLSRQIIDSWVSERSQG